MKKNKLLCPICKKEEVIYVQSLIEEASIDDIVEGGSIVLGESREHYYQNDARIECPSCESQWSVTKFIELVR